MFFKNIFNYIDDLDYLSYIKELRYRLIFVILSWIFFSIIAYLLLDFILPFIKYPIENIDLKIIHLKIYDKFLSFIKIAIYFGFIFNFPIMVYHLSRFIWPALYKQEKIRYFIILFFSNFLFLFGFLITYIFIAPSSFKFLVDFKPQESKNHLKKDVLILLEKNLKDIEKNYEQEKSSQDSFSLLFENQKILLKLMKENFLKKDPSFDIEPYINFAYYIDFLIFFSLVIAITFETPFIISIMTYYQFVSINQWRKLRRYIIAGACVFAAFITPPDILSLIIVAILIILLFELSLLFLVFFNQKKE